jgi:E3 ubiquitin ligase
MVIGGIILLVGAAVALFFWRSNAQSASHMASTSTLPCASAVGRCEVVGVAAAGPHGVLVAPESGREVVWHRTKVVEHYSDWETNSKGERKRVERQRTIASQTSALPFVVQDASGSIVVHPVDADVDSPEELADRFDRGGSVDLGEGPLADLAEGVLSGGPSVSVGGRSGAGIERKEWGILPGQQLYVLAEVMDLDGSRAMTKPSDGPFVISTRSEAQLHESKRGSAGIALAIGIVLAAAGGVLLILGIL